MALKKLVRKDRSTTEVDTRLATLSTEDLTKVVGGGDVISKVVGHLPPI